MKNNKNKVSEFVNNYKYSLRRRISITYITIYLVICVVIITTFLIGYAFYSSSEFSDQTSVVCTNVIDTFNNSENIDGLEFRYELSQIADNNHVSEILIYDVEYNLIVATTYTRVNTDYFEDVSGNFITRFFPSTAKLDQGYYSDTYEFYDETVKRELIILLYYPIDDLISQYAAIVRLLSGSMVAGLFLLMLIGFYRTERMLKPINEMTQVAKKINGENLTLRINETNAKYELKELVETINQMMDRIQESYDKQKRFVSDVSHELRTPISVVSGYASMLKRWGKNDQEVLDESIDAIINESSNMNDLVEKLLFLARHDNQRGKYEFSCFNFSELCDDAIKDTLMVHDKIQLEREIEQNLMIVADESSIKQLLRILIDNAIKYSTEGGRVSITLKEEEQNAVLHIKDYGIGISPKHLANIFDRFYRSDESRTKDTGGHGLGLAMAKIIVLGHNGRITVRSKINEGTEFIIRLPLDAEDLFESEAEFQDLE